VKKEQELQHILTWVEKFPSACPQWFWGNKVFILIYDPDCMKVILGRLGKSEIPSQLQQIFPIEFRPCIFVIP
jgi:hypothetical protein